MRTTLVLLLALICFLLYLYQNTTLDIRDSSQVTLVTTLDGQEIAFDASLQLRLSLNDHLPTP